MKVLVLAGTAEARELCACLQEIGVDVMASLAGATRKPLPLGVETRVGGFGGLEGLQTFLDQGDFDVLIDATHPFAHRMTATAAKVKRVQHAILQRPEWRAEPEDHWIEIDDPKEAENFVKKDDVVFLGTGRQTIEDFACLDHAYVYARVLDEPNSEYPHRGEYLWGRPPFSVEAEIELFKRRLIDWLIVKNSGGAASFTKLEAARALNIPVLMLRRKPLPEAKLFCDVASVMDWIKTLG